MTGWTKSVEIGREKLVEQREGGRAAGRQGLCSAWAGEKKDAIKPAASINAHAGHRTFARALRCAASKLRSGVVLQSVRAAIFAVALLYGCGEDHGFHQLPLP